MEATALSALSALGTGIGHGLAFQIAGKLIESVEDVLGHNIKHPQIIQIINELDIIASLKTVNALIKDLESNLNYCGESIKVCVSNLKNVIDSLKKCLNNIDIKCQNHNKSWWKYMYSYPDVTNESNLIKQYKNILDNRIELLTKTVTIELQTKVLINNNIIKKPKTTTNNNNNNNNKNKNNNVNDTQIAKEFIVLNNNNE